MPLIALAVAAYAVGLVAGFGSAHGIVALCVVGALTVAVVTRRVSFVAFAALLIAGDVVATERRWRDATCAARLAGKATPIHAELSVDAEPGAFATGVTVGNGCAVRVSVAVLEGHAATGAVVLLTGEVYATGAGLLVKSARVAMLRRPGALARLRSRASRALQRDFGDDAPLAKALLIAETTDLGPAVRDRFARAGLVHILSISGLHVTIVAAAVLLLLEAARLPKRYALIGACALTAFYVALIGAPPPAVRSAVMFGSLTTSRLLQRPVSPWATLALGAGWPLPGDPRVALDIGWQLTVAGMVALISAGEVNKRFVDGRLSGWRRRLVAEVVTGVIATVVTAPLVAWYFGRTALVAPLANIAASPVANVLQPTLFLALALAWWPAASSWVADAARPGLHALDGVASVAGALPGANWGSAPTLAGAVLAGIAIIAIASMIKSVRPARPLAACAAAFAALVWWPLAAPARGELEFHAIDVGQGDALALRTPAGRWILMDAGRTWIGGDAGRRTVVPYIRRRGGDVVVFVLSHPDADHVGGAASVLEALRPAAFWDGAYLGTSASYRAALAVADRRGIPWHRVHPGDTLRVDGVFLRVLAPDSAWTAASHDPNDASCVLLVEFGEVRFLLMGDAEAPEEEWIENRWGDTALHADVLKAGHHGSRTSSTPRFLDDVHPRVAVISVGAGNTYGHPNRPVLDNLASRGAVILRTDQLGSVVISTDGRRLRVAGSDGVWAIPR